MRIENIDAHTKRELKASVDHEKGMHFVDLFVDHTLESPGIHIRANVNAPISMSEHLKLILTPFACPQCGSPRVTSNHGRSLSQWFFKFAGRQIFLCNDCGSNEIVKVRRCEWETIGTAVAIALALVAMTIHWVFR